MFWNCRRDVYAGQRYDACRMGRELPARYTEFYFETGDPWTVLAPSRLSEFVMKITTERLELIASTLELARAEIEDRDRFAQLLDARVPVDWPPPLNDTDSM